VTKTKNIDMRSAMYTRLSLNTSFVNLNNRPPNTCGRSVLAKPIVTGQNPRNSTRGSKTQRLCQRQHRDIPQTPPGLTRMQNDRR
jgi:hypothetical protein